MQVSMNEYQRTRSSHVPHCMAATAVMCASPHAFVCYSATPPYLPHHKAPAPVQSSRTARSHLAGEAQHEFGIDPSPGAQQRHCSSDDQGHLPAGEEGDDVCCNDGDQGLDDQAQLVPHCPPDVQGVCGQPGCNCPTGVLLLVEPAHFLCGYINAISECRCSILGCL